MLGVGDCTSDCFFFPMYNFPGAEEQAKREAAEREKESLEKQVKELQQNLEDQGRVFQRLRTEMTEEMRESEKASAGTGESSFHSGVGRFLQCPLRL